MPSWNDLLHELEAIEADKDKAAWLRDQLTSALKDVSSIREGRNVLFYSSAFLQKHSVPPPLLQITHEDINGFMSVMYGMEWDANLTLILHTPGGVPNAAETIVAYLWSKFDFIEVIVPAFAMSAGTMISLGTDHIVMGRQSQLGPIDPQMPVKNRVVSARAIKDQFKRARKEVLVNQTAAHVWAPVLQTMGPSLLQEAENALDYGEEMVAEWLEKRMFKSDSNPRQKAKAAAHHFNDAGTHKSHGRRIDRDEARSQGLSVEDLEDDQQLQESVLTAYHLATLAFEKGPTTKMIHSHAGRSWLKNFQARART